METREEGYADIEEEKDFLEFFIFSKNDSLYCVL